MKQWRTLNIVYEPKRVIIMLLLFGRYIHMSVILKAKAIRTILKYLAPVGLLTNNTPFLIRKYTHGEMDTG